jgi:hypothetical protein
MPISFAWKSAIVLLPFRLCLPDLFAHHSELPIDRIPRRVAPSNPAQHHPDLLLQLCAWPWRIHSPNANRNVPIPDVRRRFPRQPERKCHCVPSLQIMAPSLALEKWYPTFPRLLSHCDRYHNVSPRNSLSLMTSNGIWQLLPVEMSCFA